jgi:hypothetical protein
MIFFVNHSIDIDTHIWMQNIHPTIDVQTGHPTGARPEPAVQA